MQREGEIMQGEEGTIQRTRRILLFAALLLLMGGQGAAAQPFDHRGFDLLLRDHVDALGRVDYDAFATSESFQRYLEALDRVEPGGMEEADQIALWINAYNAWTIQQINRYGERRSIRNIGRVLGVLPGSAAWREPVVRVGGRRYTLDEVEHEVLRREFDEPRVHFALVCAALGCPPLRQEAYTGERLHLQLEDQFRRFLHEDPSKNRIDLPSRTLHLSRIFDWYGSDFGESPAAIGRYLARWYEGAEAELLRSGTFRIRYTSYDWSLNVQPTRR